MSWFFSYAVFPLYNFVHRVYFAYGLAVSRKLLTKISCIISSLFSFFFFFFFFGRSGRRTPEKTKKNANGRKDGDDELRNGQRRNSLDEGDVLRAVVCDYVGPRGVCRNAEAGHTAAVASKTDWVACHTRPRRRMVRAATPAECLVGRTGGDVPRAQRSAGASWRSRASQSNLTCRRPLCFNGARTERRTEQRTAIQEHPLVVGGCFVFPGARTKRWPAAAAPNMPSPTARSRTLSAAAARDAPPARTQLAEAARPSTSRSAGAAILSAPRQAMRAHRMRDGSVPTSISGKTDARGFVFIFFIFLFISV